MHREPFKNHRGMRLMQDGAASHTALTTLNLLQAHRVNVLPCQSKSPDRNSIKRIWNVNDRVVRRRGPTNSRQYRNL